jgi:hypothetical protein
MPYIWFDGKHYEDIYSAWATIISIDDKEYIPIDKDIFKDRNILLILACEREFYKNRLDNNMETFDFFKKHNFVIVYLYAKKDINTALLYINSVDDYSLYVPCEDTYEFLTFKMQYAFDYFSDKSCNGILKIDDNTQILDKKVFINDILPLIKTNDYFGIVTVSFQNTSFIYDKRFTEKTLKRLRYISTEKIIYYGGPFYWVSSKAIEEISKKVLEFIYEDVSVGYIMNNNIELVKPENSLEFFFKKVVGWDSITE